MAVLGENGVQTLDVGFATPKGTSLRGTVSFDVLCVKIGGGVSAVAFPKNPPPQKKKIAKSPCAEGREITHAQNRSP